jgi:hypothetical protein
MGMAVYYLKARFPKGALRKHFPEIQKLWREGPPAADFWQENRGKKPAEFWPKFVEKFPLVTEYLRTIASRENPDAGSYRVSGVSSRDEKFVKDPQPHSLVGLDCNNELAGTLNFGETGDFERLEHDGVVLYFNAEVWHFADWEPLMAFLKNKWGATAAGYLSDEYTEEHEDSQGYYDAIGVS